MRSVLKNYTFNTVTKAITLTDISTVRLDRLALITDVTTNKVLYNFADSSIATATVATNVVTLSALQGGESNTDKLRIDYDVDPADTAFGDSTEAVKLAAGSAKIGTVTTDQTTHGTTDLVAADVTKVAGTAIDTNSGSKSAGTQRVVIATDQPQLTNALKVDGSATTQPVSDGGGSLTVDGTVGVSGTVTIDSELTVADLDTGAGTDTRAVVGIVGSKSGGAAIIPGDATKGLAVDLTNTGANSTAIKVDGSAVTQPVSGSVTANAGTNLNTSALALDATLTGGNQQVQGNIASGSTDSGNPIKVGTKFNSTQPTFTDGQRVDLQTTNRGELKTTIATSGNSAAVQVSMADGRSNTVGSLAVASYVTIFNGTTWDRQISVANGTNSVGTGITAAGIIAQFDDTSPTAITENQFGNVRMSANRNLYGTIRDAAGNERGANVNASNQLSVSVDGTNAVTNAGTFAVQATIADGADSTLGAKADAKSTATDTTAISVVSILKQISASVQAPPSQAVTNAGTFATQENGSALTSLQLIDDPVFADDAAYTLSTSKGSVIEGVAVETDGTDPTSVSAEGDASAVRTDRNRRLLVNTAHPNLWSANDNQSSAQTNTSLKAAPGASLSLYITDVMVSNGATAGDIRIVEDPAGTPVIRVPKIYVAINGGAVMHFNTPIRISANKAVGYTSTTVTTHSVMVSGYIAP